MVDATRLAELLARWESAREQGTSIDLESLCSDYPEHIESVRQAIVERHGDAAITVSHLEADHTHSFVEGSDSGPSPGSRAYRPGESVAGFRLLREIGHGGFGQVFESEDPILKRKVAIKFLRGDLLNHGSVRDLFLNEARAMAAIQHDHVISIHQVGQDGGNLFLVMPLLAGETLASRLQREGILPMVEVQRIGRELASGLAAIHAKGLIHRDIKPANIWLEAGSGRVKVLDLGLAEDAASIRQGSSAGTPAYMSPEQVRGEELDFRSDLFSVGAVLYECVTAKRAFPGDTITQVFDGVTKGELLSVLKANPGVPPALAELIAKLLEKDQNQRPKSTQEVLTALDGIGKSGTEKSKPLWLVPLFAAAAMVIIVSAVVLMNRGQQTQQHDIADTTPSLNSDVEVTPLPPLAVEDLRVIPYRPVGEQHHPLPPLGHQDAVLPTTSDSIEVRARLSRPAYSYIVLFRGDGRDQVLYPQDDTDIPELTAEPRYPTKRLDVLYGLDDGPGLWLVAVIASDEPLPSYRDWRQAHPGSPWRSHPNPNMLHMVVLDDGSQWKDALQTRSFTRGEKKIADRSQIVELVDWLKQSSGAKVQALAFPVLP